MPGADDRAPGPRPQHHRRLAIVTSALLAVALVFGIGGAVLPRGESLWHLLTAPPEDGAWTVVTLDGRDVRSEAYAVGVVWGEITSFHDGCNACGFDRSRDADDARGGRALICTLAACEERPQDARFRRIVHGSPRMRLQGDRLILSVPGHRAELVRGAAR